MPEAMNILEPLTTEWSPSRRGVVLRLATSEPPDGSVMASALIFWPASTSGRTLRFIHSGPRAAMGGHPIVWLLRLAFTPPLLWRAISRALMKPKNGSVGTPAYSSEQ